MLEELKEKLERIEKEIKIYKSNLIDEVQKEEMIPASKDLFLLRDLKEQQATIEKIIKKMEKEKE